MRRGTRRAMVYTTGDGESGREGGGARDGVRDGGVSTGRERNG